MFPRWTKSDEKYEMCLTDDLDSLFGCIILQQIKGYKISRFYSFNKLYNSKSYKETKMKVIGVDMDLVEYACWGNHVTGIKNPRSANLNVISRIDKYNYTEKYGGSTLLEIISYYDYDISKLSDEAKMVLLCIDSAYLGYFYNDINMRIANHEYLCNVLELEELYLIQKRHTREDFEAIKEKYKLDEKIYYNKNTGRLKTKIDLERLSLLFNLPFALPKDKFVKKDDYIVDKVYVDDYDNFVYYKQKQGYKVFTQAQISKNLIKLSYIENKDIKD